MNTIHTQKQPNLSKAKIILWPQGNGDVKGGGGIFNEIGKSQFQRGVLKKLYIPVFLYQGMVDKHEGPGMLNNGSSVLVLLTIKTAVNCSFTKIA